MGFITFSKALPEEQSYDAMLDVFASMKESISHTAKETAVCSKLQQFKPVRYYPTE